MTFVSVIIPVYGDAGKLGECLDCLALQTWPHFETIVVDNGCSGIEAILARHPSVRLVRESKPGSYAARNAGLRVARGEVIAFTDADCLPNREWIERGVAESEQHPVIAGGIDLIAPRPPGVSLTAYRYNFLLAFHKGGFQRCGGFAATANLFVRRAILDEVGHFNERLLSGGDMEWGKRAAERGYRPHYVGAARISHQARPWPAIVTRAIRLAGGTQVQSAATLPQIVIRELWYTLRWELGEVRPPNRLQVSALVVLVQTLRAAERIRVKFGGAPRRA